MGLFDPIWKKATMFDKKKEEKAKDYIRKAIDRDDQKELIAIATKAPNAELRWFAAAHVKSEEILKQIACQDPSVEVRSHALCNINDEAFLVGYAVKIDNRDLSLLCIERVKSQEALALIAANTDSEYKINACLKRMNKTPSQNVIKILDANKNRLVQDFLAPYRSAEERNRTVFSEKDSSVRERIIRTLTDYKILYRCATEDPSGNCRIAAYQVLRKQKSSIPGDWWRSHMTEDTNDQRLAIWVKTANENSENAGILAEILRDVWKYGNPDKSYIIRHCPKSVIEIYEKKLSAGDANAARVLMCLYRDSHLNPALSGYVKEQQKRMVQSHKDAMVDSDVCGETLRHEDYSFDSDILPL